MIHEQYSSAIPQLFGAVAITFGNHIFYHYPEDLVEQSLRNHEHKHVEQYKKYGFFRFLYLYLKEYYSNRRKGLTKYGSYRMISFEIEATQAEGENTNGN